MRGLSNFLFFFFLPFFILLDKTGSLLMFSFHFFSHCTLLFYLIPLPSLFLPLPLPPSPYLSILIPYSPSSSLSPIPRFFSSIPNLVINIISLSFLSFLPPSLPPFPSLFLLFSPLPSHHLPFSVSIILEGLHVVLFSYYCIMPS